MKNSIKPSEQLRRDSKLAVKQFFRRFSRKYKTEADYAETIFLLLKLSEILKCKRCGKTEIVRQYGAREAKCLKCKKRIRITADTVFRRSKTLGPWLAAILMMEQGIPFNASDLSKGCGIRHSSAWTTVKKLSMIINQYMTSHPNLPTVYSAAFAEVFTKRSLATPANEHPRSEQNEFEQSANRIPDGNQEQGDGQNQSPVVDSSHTEKKEVAVRVLNTGELKILELLQAGPMNAAEINLEMDLSTGQLASHLLALEMDQLIECLAGGNFRLFEGKASKNVPVGSPASLEEILAGSENSSRLVVAAKVVMEHLKREFGGISRKYLQLYLANYWGLVDKTRWSGATLVEACRRSEAITGREIRAFVSPLFVAIAA